MMFEEQKGMPRKNDLEHIALTAISNEGAQGILQSDLWRKLGAGSREGSRISIKLEKKGLIRRERELNGGRWTHRLYPKRPHVSISSIVECPCLMCGDDSRCGMSGLSNAISPVGCDRLSLWISDLAGKVATI